MGNRSDKVPNMDLQPMAAEELSDGREETMSPSTAGPTATAFTLAMEGPLRHPQTMERKHPLSNSLHTLKATSPILETLNPTERGITHFGPRRDWNHKGRSGHGC